MLFNPDDGLTEEQIIDKALDVHGDPAIRARVQAIAEARGLTVYEWCAIAIQEGEAAAKANPATQGAETDFLFAPYGEDPLLRKDR